MSVAARRQRLRELIDRRGLGAVVLRRPANFAWYTGGGDSRVDHVASEGVADVVVCPDGDYVLASRIEAPRMRTEQTRGIEVIEYDWYGDRALPYEEAWELHRQLLAERADELIDDTALFL